MATKKITIQVSPEAAGVYESASEQERRKLDALLSLQLTEARQTNRPIEQIMKEASAQARRRGMSEKVLDEILSER